MGVDLCDVVYTASLSANRPGGRDDSHKVTYNLLGCAKTSFCMLRMKIAKLIPYFSKHMSINTKKGEILFMVNIYFQSRKIFITAAVVHLMKKRLIHGIYIWLDSSMHNLVNSWHASSYMANIWPYWCHIISQLWFNSSS